MIIVTVLGILLFARPVQRQPAGVRAWAPRLFLFVVLGLGVFISTISQTAGQAIQTAFFFLLPQILLSGMIFPLDAMAAGVRWIGYLLPLTYFTMISQGIMLRGAPIASLWLPFVVLAVMAVVVFTGATLRFRRDLAPGRNPDPARPGHGRPRPSPPPQAAKPARRAPRDVRRCVRPRCASGRPWRSTTSPSRCPADRSSPWSAATARASRRCCARWPARWRWTAARWTHRRRQRLGYLPASSGSWAALTVTQNIDFVGGHLRPGRRRARGPPRRAAGPGGAHAGGRTGSPRSCPAGCAASSASAWRWCTGRRCSILDEPSTGVDPVSRIDLWRLVSEAAASARPCSCRRPTSTRPSAPRTCVVLDRGRVLVAGLLRRGARGLRRRRSPGPTSPSGPSGPGGAGRARHEYWPDADQRRRPGDRRRRPTWRTSSIALSLARRTRRGVGHDRGALLRAAHVTRRFGDVHRGGRRVDAGAGRVRSSACSAPTERARPRSSGCCWDCSR